MNYYKMRKKIKRFLNHTWYHTKESGWSLVFVILGGLCILGGIFFIWVATLRIPSFQSLDDRVFTSSTKIYDRTGEVLLYDVFEDVKRTIVTGDQIAPVIKEAVLAVEDKDFYNHNGIRVRSTLRGVIVTVFNRLGLSNGGTQGGSTITQQVIKNALLTQERAVSRKLKEWILAIKLEQQISKDEILTLYLNEVPFGGTLYGIEEASKAFFGIPASEVTLAQAAYLAAIPNAPSFFSPYGPNRERLDERKNLILRLMREQERISAEEYESARNEIVEFLPRQANNAQAMHFVEYVRAYLENRYGRDAVLNEGLQVITTLDYDMHQVAEAAIYENALANLEAYNASNAALVALDPRTGEILSMIGSRDFFDTEIDGFFNVATAERQPGSSFKPFIYAEAFRQGFTPETIVFDVPTQFSGRCAPESTSSTLPCYAPQNYDGNYIGPVSLRDALGQSRNIPAVKLLYLVGTENALRRAKEMGISTLDRNADRYGLTLVLGGGEVTLLEMTSAYGVFAQDGMRATPTAILEVRDKNGEVLESFVPRRQRVLDAEAARIVNDVLKDNEARTPLFGSRSFMFFEGREVAAKTGTTNDNKDAWLIGYSPQIVVGVWSGNNDNTPMRRGSSISGPAWRRVMEHAFTKLPNEPFISPAETDVRGLKPILRGEWLGGESIIIDTVSQKRATERTPEETRQEIIIPDPHSILHWIIPQNPRGPIPENPEDNPQYVRWEYGVQAWVRNNLGSIPNLSIPDTFDNVHIPENEPRVRMIGNEEVLVFPESGIIPLTVSVESNYPITRIDYFVNGILLGSTQSASTPFILERDRIENVVPGENILRIQAVDTIFNRGSLEIPLR
jgi:penicillin-binding protein 1C